MKPLLAASALVLSFGLFAQGPQAPPPVTPTQFAYYSGADLKAMSNTAKAGGQVKWNRIHRGDHDFQSFNFRPKSTAAPEMHNNWADLYYIVDGEVNHLTGGTLEGATERTPGSGEFGGGKIVGGTTAHLVAGDIASSAAGVPHWWDVPAGKTVTYITVKVLKQPTLQGKILAPNPPALTPTKFAHYKGTDLKAMAQTLASGGQAKLERIHRGDHDFQGINFRKASSTGPEMHNNWADLYFVIDGEVTIRYGDRLEGGKEGVDGEVRGGEIAGNVKTQKLVAGDIASSPAGIPHFWEVEPGKSVTYMTVKLGKQH
jgi:quercetin dioxygenase-like cupin family protein/mannose-6-phosphate isomerase-like protein (cupin superfamily)